MSILKSFFTLFLFFGLFITACSKKNYPSISLNPSLKQDLEVLASDAMEGREVGSKGEEMAANFLAERFKKIGLLPAGDQNMYFQVFSRKSNRNPHATEATDGQGPTIVGKNVVGYIDHKAENTVVIGAHYDHLGYGHEGSLYTGDKAIHNGADDNASGVAGLLLLAENLQKSAFKNNNYLFICFSGEEKGLWGSNYFVNHTSEAKKVFNYMINMDMIGRLNEEKKLAVSGVGTSPVFDEILTQCQTDGLKVKKESSGMGPSDHASFYNAEVPVLAFFTGQHQDYHKPSDDAHLINYKGVEMVIQYVYNIVGALDKKGKLAFTKTVDESSNKVSFTVTLGVMPDYLFDGEGMKIDGVKDGKPAQVSGMQKGDIVVKMGELPVPDMQSYMKCLSIFKKGQTVDVVILRDGKEMIKQVTF